MISTSPVPVSKDAMDQGICILKMGIGDVVQWGSGSGPCEKGAGAAL